MHVVIFFVFDRRGRMALSTLLCWRRKRSGCSPSNKPGKSSVCWDASCGEIASELCALREVTRMIWPDHSAVEPTYFCHYCCCLRCLQLSLNLRTKTQRIDKAVLCWSMGAAIQRACNKTIRLLAVADRLFCFPHSSSRLVPKGSVLPQRQKPWGPLHGTYSSYPQKGLHHAIHDRSTLSSPHTRWLTRAIRTR